VSQRLVQGVVVVGASFGGFDALKVVLGSLPATFPAPLVIVQHQGSSGNDLATLLQRHTALVVVDAEDKDQSRPGVAYLAPSGYHVLVEPGSLALSVDPPVLHARPSIDVLFESAADVYGPRVIGVILTGTGRDGAAGLARIKQRGGTAIVQDPRTALKSAMPEAALASTAVDWTLQLEEIGPRLVELHAAALSSSRAATPQLMAPESRWTRI
jgi:two-component system, chemotaxis family, protein-glutamate methylesterase/glutaminase